MRARPDYDESNPDEVECYGMDFTADLDIGEQIVSGTLTLSVVQGSDPAPQSHVSGEMVISNNGTKLSQVLSRLVGGAKYCVLFTAQTNFGYTHQLYSHVYCRVPA